MSSEITARDEAELEALLARRSVLSADYKALEVIEPPEALDARVLAGARAAAAPPAAKPAAPGPASAAPAVGSPTPVQRTATSRPVPVRRDEDDGDDDEDEDADPAPSRRPRWLVPAVAAAAALAAIGIGAMLLGDSSDGFDANDSSAAATSLARRVRERLAADKAEKEAAEAAAGAAEVELELAPLPPPPIFEVAGPQVEDLEASIALVRRELVRANQAAAMAQAAAAADATSASPAAPVDGVMAGIIQSRDRRLAKILELYEAGNQDLAADSLEIFLRDFPDAPISQQIMDAQPEVTDIAVE